ncbi:hypothetical protein IW261DRAFT_1683737 [Armillaria novae-zelandiae]|uniref:Uncharacterized protein n=1 Tax=Armillaria novae-zelandiae TaxID=153914 RepID=A0AA39NJ71_9AGAR|nr:hypothetical protein IW261DRAFT_1683737 [Armillaria novae-zelandiae]
MAFLPFDEQAPFSTPSSPDEWGTLFVASALDEQMAFSIPGSLDERPAFLAAGELNERAPLFPPVRRTNGSPDERPTFPFLAAGALNERTPLFPSRSPDEWATFLAARALNEQAPLSTSSSPDERPTFLAAGAQNERVPLFPSRLPDEWAGFLAASTLNEPAPLSTPSSPDERPAFYLSANDLDQQTPFYTISSRDDRASQDPTLKPVPDGYLLVKPATKWREKLALDNRHNVYYEREPKTTSLPCSFLGCTQSITGRSIRDHKQLTTKSYPDHVRGKHCGVSARCAYCDEPKAKGFSVARHCISVCTALILFRRIPPDDRTLSSPFGPEQSN